MDIKLAATLIIYIAIVITALLSNQGRKYLFGAFFIACCLLFLELPDLEAYVEHYQLAASEGFMSALLSNNFEFGYVALVSICSEIMPFWMFYIGVIICAISSYLKFSSINNSCAPYIFTCFLLSACLYFFSFTIRTTIASIFLSYSLIRLKEEKNTSALILLLAGMTFHMVIAPMLVVPVLNKFRPWISRHYRLCIFFAGIISFIFADIISISSLSSVGGFVENKIFFYQDQESLISGFFFMLWIFIIVSSLFLRKHVDSFDRVLLVSITSILILLYPYGFFQGRFMWLTSFIFAYFFTKIFFNHLRFGKLGQIFFTMSLSLIVFSRF